MAEDIAREIIAQSQGGSKLAFSFHYGQALLYTSKGADEKILYHVHRGRNNIADDDPQYEFKYADLESAVDLVRTFVPYESFIADVVLYNEDGIDCEEVLHLGRLSSSNLTDFLQDKMKILDVVNVETK